jgi:hypothetical protein
MLCSFGPCPSRHVDEDDGCKRTALTVALELVLRGSDALTSRTATAGLLARAIPSSFTVRLGQHVRDAVRPRDCDEGSWPSSGAPTERASRSPTRRTTAASSDRPDLYCPSLQSPPRAASCSARSLVLHALDRLGTQDSSARHCSQSAGSRPGRSGGSADSTSLSCRQPSDEPASESYIETVHAH